ncbi:MAG: hypothetical protein LBK04_02775, partial [Clostridiales Family XIII bacterium]|nr:hypothetical protein [Clostridiales Family XIII bacterium]
MDAKSRVEMRRAKAGIARSRRRVKKMRLSVCVPGLAIVIGIGCGMYFGDGGYPQNQKSLLTYT